MIRKMLSYGLLLFSLSACSALPSLPSITPIDMQVGKNNIDNTVASQSNQLGDSLAQSTEYTFNTSTSMIASFFAGGVLVMLSSLGFVYIIVKQSKGGSNGQT